MRTCTKHHSASNGFRLIFLQFLFAILCVQPCWAYKQIRVAVSTPHAKGLYITDPDNYLVYRYEIDVAGELINQFPQIVECPHASYIFSDPLHHYIYVTCGYWRSINSPQVVVAAFPLLPNGRIGNKRVDALDTSQSGSGVPTRNLTYNSLYAVEGTDKVSGEKATKVFSKRIPRFEVLIHSFKFQPGGRLRTIGTLPSVCTDFSPLVFDNSGRYAYLSEDGRVLCFRMSSSKVLASFPLATVHGKTALKTTALIANRTKPYVYSVVGRRIEVHRIETDGHLAPASQTTGPVLHLDKRLPYASQLFLDPTGHFLYELGPLGPLLGFKIRSDGMIDTTPFLASTVIDSDGNIKIQFHPQLHIAYVIGVSAQPQAYHIQTDGKFVLSSAPPAKAPLPGSRLRDMLVL